MRYISDGRCDQNIPTRLKLPYSKKALSRDFFLAERSLCTPFFVSKQTILENIRKGGQLCSAYQSPILAFSIGNSLTSMQTCAFLFYYRVMHWLLLYRSVSSFKVTFAREFVQGQSWAQFWTWRATPCNCLPLRKSKNATRQSVVVKRANTLTLSLSSCLCVFANAKTKTSSRRKRAIAASIGSCQKLFHCRYNLNRSFLSTFNCTDFL